MTPKEKFVDLLEKLLPEIDKIDKETPFQHVEPEWWCHMMDVERIARELILRYKK